MDIIGNIYVNYCTDTRKNVLIYFLITAPLRTDIEKISPNWIRVIKEGVDKDFAESIIRQSDAT